MSVSDEDASRSMRHWVRGVVDIDEHPFGELRAADRHRHGLTSGGGAGARDG
jgi:hypothetical protein